MARGIIAIAIDKDDDLIDARITDGKQTIFLGTREGMAIRFEEEYDPDRSGIGPPPMGRNAAGKQRHLAQKKRSGHWRCHHRFRCNADRNRDECAAALKLTPKLEALRAAHAKAKEALHKAREEKRNGDPTDERLKAAEKAAERAVDDAEKALKQLDERLGVSNT